MSKKTIIIIAVVLIVLGAAAYYYWGVYLPKKANASTDKTTVPGGTGLMAATQVPSMEIAPAA